MKIEFKNVDMLRLSVESYDIHYNRYLNNFNGYPDKPGNTVEIIFNDTRELNELIYILCNVRKRLEVMCPHFIDPFKQGVMDDVDIALLQKLMN